MDRAITAQGVGKRFRLEHDRPRTVKEGLVRFRRRSSEEFWALRDIDIEVDVGETMGLLGHNGSGKSTLLKCIAGILQPTRGSIRTRGRVAALLELGAGFHPDLTGRENVYLNGSILGLSRREVAERFDEIVAFAELERFIDTQVKHYSSGMFARLGFAVAVHVDPDILLVDEVLAVGDAAFQRKCLSRIQTLQNEGRSIVFVTHSVELARRVCDRAVVLDHGQLVTVGDPEVAVQALREKLGQPADSAPEGVDTGRGRTYDLRIQDVTVRYPNPDEPFVTPRERLELEVVLFSEGTVEDLVLGMSIHDELGTRHVGTNTALRGIELGSWRGVGRVTFALPSVPLAEGRYLLTFTAHDLAGDVVYDQRVQEDAFYVRNPWPDIEVEVARPPLVDVERSL